MLRIPLLPRWLLLLMICCAASSQAVLADEAIPERAKDKPAFGEYFPGEEGMRKLKDHLSAWTADGVTDLWIDEDYGSAPLSRQEAAALSQYPLVEHITFGRPGPEIVHLTAEVLREFRKCPRLKSMNLNLDRFEPEMAGTLGEFGHLEFLGIHVLNNGVSKPVPRDGFAADLLKLEKLESLSINGSDFTNQFLQDLRKARALRYLSVGSGQFNEHTFDILGGMKLEDLSVAVPDLKKWTLKGLEKSGLRRLIVIDAGLNRSTLLQDFSMEAVESLLKMRNLEMLHNLALSGKPESAEYARAREKLLRHLEENRKRNAEQDRGKQHVPD